MPKRENVTQSMRNTPFSYHQPTPTLIPDSTSVVATNETRTISEHVNSSHVPSIVPDSTLNASPSAIPTTVMPTPLLDHPTPSPTIHEFSSIPPTTPVPLSPSTSIPATAAPSYGWSYGPLPLQHFMNTTYLRIQSNPRLRRNQIVYEKKGTTGMAGQISGVCDSLLLALLHNRPFQSKQLTPCFSKCWLRPFPPLFSVFPFQI